MVEDSKKIQQISIITKNDNNEINFEKDSRGFYFKKLMNMCISIVIRSRFKKPLKKIYDAFKK